MIHDIFIPFVAEKFEEMGFTKLWDPDKAVLIYDHLVPASQLDDCLLYTSYPGSAHGIPADWLMMVPGR